MGFHHKKKRGAYLFSADGKDRWSLSDWELFPSEIRWDDNTTQFLLKQQRPSIIFDVTGRPSHLVTGVDFLFDPCCDWYGYGSGWTLVQPISPCAAEEGLSAGSCVECDKDAPKFRGRCEKTTSKYGDCVCGKCSGSYTGDECEIAPVPVYTVSCAEFDSRTQCASMSGSRTWIGKPSSIDCKIECEKHATANGLEGRCFKYDSGTAHENCRFFDGQLTTAPANQDTKAATICTKRQIGVKPAPHAATKTAFVSV